MKQKYIIGDLVQYQDTIYNIRGFRIDYRDNYICSIGFDGSSTEIKEDYLTPIPLTPEILEKNGWKKNNGVFGSFEYSKKFDANTFVITESRSVLVFWYRECYLLKINFVHQLQHLLFGFGLNSEMEV